MIQLSSKFLCKENDFFYLDNTFRHPNVGNPSICYMNEVWVFFSSTELKPKYWLLLQFLDVLALTFLVLSYVHPIILCRRTCTVPLKRKWFNSSLCVHRNIWFDQMPLYTVKFIVKRGLWAYGLFHHWHYLVQMLIHYLSEITLL